MRLHACVGASAICSSVLVLILASDARGDDISAGPNGINARVTGLTGVGQNIGQVELGRPGEKLSVPADANGEWFWDYGPDGIRGNNDVGENDVGTVSFRDAGCGEQG